MKSDATIKEDVLSELAWQPNIDETQVGVLVDKVVVTLTGTVDNYAKKRAAEKSQYVKYHLYDKKKLYL
jgi:osmotically-inducible protein OsmY